MLLGGSLLYSETAETARAMRDADLDRERKAKPSLLSASTFPADVLSIDLKDNKKLYTNLDYVAGTISHGPALVAKNAVLIVSLLGVSHVKLDTWSPDRMGYVTKRVEWTFLRQAQDDQGLRSPGQSDFAFELPAALQPRQCPRGDIEHLSLPPSIGTHARNDRLRDMTTNGVIAASVYLIRAEVRDRSTGEVVGHASQRFHFCPDAAFSHSSPRAYSSKWRSNYAWSTALQTKLGQRFGSLAINSDEDLTLVTNATEMTASSSIDLDLSFSGSRPPSITRSRLILRARTLRRTTHSHDDDEPEHASFETRFIGHSKLGAASTRDWQAVGTTPGLWKVGLSVPVSLIDDNSTVILPSFESCLVSRRYELQIELSLASGTLLGLQNAQFIVPVTIRTPSRLVDVLEKCPSSADLDVLGDVMPSYGEVVVSSADVAPMARTPEYRDHVSLFESNRRPSWQEKDSRPACVDIRLDSETRADRFDRSEHG